MRTRITRFTRITPIVSGACALAAVLTLTAAAVTVPEADLAYHGSVAMADGRVDLRLTPQNHGPADVPDATVRLRWSVPLADRQDARALPVDCARADERTVLCRTGPLPAGTLGERLRLRLRLKGAPDGVTLGIDTVWGGGAVDRNHGNDRQRVLALDTGDVYFF
ncbi:hypothetical protein OK074_4025 [Actinobacteria bacterium OK074]|nr:hypothetical protein OK074_4025 [Actinobacteria bacterium OK074]